MHGRQAEQLALAVAAIQQRWGQQAIAPLREVERRYVQATLPTGLMEVDTLLDGGLPQGQMTLLTGAPGSGRSTFVLRTLANAQNRQCRTTYLDFGSTFDAEQGQRCGVDLDALLLVRPQCSEDGLEIASELIDRYGVGLLVLDQTFEPRTQVTNMAALSSAVRRLAAILRRSSCALLCLPPLHVGAVHLQAQTSLALRLERLQWLKQWGDVVGLEARLTVTRHKSGKVGQQTRFRIDLHQRDKVRP